MIIISRTLLDILTLKNKKVTAMALWPFLIYCSRQVSEDKYTVNHEKIHHRQQLEMLLVFYYTWYFTEYWIGMIRFRNHDKAYRNVSFEKEAYAMQHDLGYLKTRRFMSSLKWMGKE